MRGLRPIRIRLYPDIRSFSFRLAFVFFRLFFIFILAELRINTVAVEVTAYLLHVFEFQLIVLFLPMVKNLIIFFEIFLHIRDSLFESHLWRGQPASAASVSG